MAHRPMYCTVSDFACLFLNHLKFELILLFHVYKDNDGDDCTKDSDIVRVGYPIIKSFGLEKLFRDYGVDCKFALIFSSNPNLWFNQLINLIN